MNEGVVIFLSKEYHMYQQQLQKQLLEKQALNYDEILTEITRYDFKPSLLLMSGGIDSTLLLYELCDRQIPVTVLYFDYGQEAMKEWEYVRKHCNHLRVKIEVMKLNETDLSGELGVGGERRYNDSVMIPNRNSVFLSLATSYALKNGLERIYYGAIGGTDPSYCDCQPLFVHQYNLLNMTSDLRCVQIRTPLITWNKEEIIDKLLSYGVNLTDVWTCERNGETPCGECTACICRRRDERNYKYSLNNKLRRVSQSLNSYN